MIRTSLSLCAALIALPLVAETRGPNVLFIAIDDLRPHLGAYGEEPVITPHLDKLAAQGRLFHNHYTQVPTCGASRFSMLTGSYPRRAAAFDNAAFKLVPESKPAQPYSLPGLFLDNGYTTVSLGKISHSPSGVRGPFKSEKSQDGAAANVELPFSWSRVWGPVGEWGNSENAFFAYAGGKTRIRGKTPAVEAADVPDHGYPDASIADQAIKELQRLKDGPFFLAVGFYKPHLPFTAPKSYWDLYERENIPLAPNPLATPGLEINRKTGGEMFASYTIDGEIRSSVDDSQARLLRHGYYASVSYVDAQIGRLLAELDRLDLARNTIVVVWGDHGWHLGDAGAWGKHTLHERALRSALIIRTPDAAQPGVATRRIVESIDLMPTLAEACGLTPPAGLDGKSLLPLLRDPAADWDHPARYFWGKGEAVRTDPWCLKEWTGPGGKVMRTELFDHRNDPDELRNVAADHPEVVEKLRKKLLRHAEAAKP